MQESSNHLFIGSQGESLFCNVQYEYYKEVIIKIRDKRKYSNVTGHPK